MTELERRVQDVFQEVFQNPSLEISDGMQAKDVKGWDSLNHVTLIMALEDTFNVKFGIREVMSFKNVGEMMASLRKKTAEPGHE